MKELIIKSLTILLGMMLLSVQSSFSQEDLRDADLPGKEQIERELPVIPYHGEKIKMKIPHDLDSYQYNLVPSVVPKDPNRDYTVLKQDFLITLRDGVKMDCSKFYPSEPNIYLPNGYPVVIMVHGYADRKEVHEQMARAQAEYNYVVYTYSVRGQGNSEGLSNLISKVEALDLMELVNYVKLDNVGGDSNSVLIMGGSQGGTLPYMASCMGMKVKAIISSVTSPQFASSWIDNGSIKMTFLWTIEYEPTEARYTPLVDRMSDWVYASGYKTKLWDSLNINVPKDRDFSDIVYKNTTPIMVENSWQDYFFNARQGIESFPNITAPKYVYLGAVMGHGGDTYPPETNWHMSFFNEFFFHYLWGYNQGLDTRPDFHYALTTFPRQDNMWSYIHDSSAVWPPVGYTNTRYYFNSRDKLTTTKNTSNTASKSFSTGAKVNNLAMTYCVNEEFTGTEFASKFAKQEVSFYSPVLTSAKRWVGAPEIKLTYSSSADICQFNFQIYEQRSNGEIQFINRVNYTDRNYTANAKKSITIKGIGHAHQFQSGSKILVKVTNLDTRPGESFLGTNPHVLPILKKGTNKIFFNESYIDIPMKNAIGTDNMTTNIQSRESEETTLFDNSPNPFNPSTKIKFSLPADYNGMVTLKIYDIVGREVATLVNQSLAGGLHEYNWNATTFASGMYFFRLSTDNFVGVKKMMLIK
ncbi:MAG TPA: alpha/beta fold hydrolase [Ignavibacteria bacterium]|nr:alpha/beta fold hydrolase [Ignavibacteria bacterium]